MNVYEMIENQHIICQHMQLEKHSQISNFE